MCDMTEESGKNWGTIFLGTDREVSLDQLSAASPKGNALWNRDQEAIYLDRVQRRARDEARTILTQAVQERAALLEETLNEIARMREEAEQRLAASRAECETMHAGAVQLQEDSARLREEAGLLHAGAKEAGYAAGIGQAQAELEHFRAVMGESVGAVLSAVQTQCQRIFDAWKADLCALLFVCVEKGTGLVLDRDRTLLLERLLVESVKLLEERASVRVRVQPGDEAAVADMFAAAKERIPGLGTWSVQGDPDLAPGDLVLESAHSRVESRIEEHRVAVDAALRHIELPAVPDEEKGREELARVSAGAVTRMLKLVPERALVSDGSPSAASHEAALTVEHEVRPGVGEAVPGADDAMPGADGTMLGAEHDHPDDVQDAAEEMHAPAPTLDLPTDLPPSPVPKVDLSKVWASETPLVADAADATDAVDAVLAEGGFLPAAGDA
jgi:flagellar assembly protein FliH